MKKNYSFLVIEDNEGDILLLRKMLSKLSPPTTFAMSVVHTLNELDSNDYEKTDFDVIFLDLNLSDSSGENTFITVYLQFSQVPIIIFSGMEDTQLANRLISMGAQDFLVKGYFDEHVLSRSISYSIQRKKVIDELQKFKMVVEQSPHIVFFTDKQGFIQYANTTFEKKTGYNRNEVIGKNPKILKSGQTPLETYQDMWETILSGHQWTGEIVNRKKNEEEYIVTSKITPLKNDLGQISHLLAIQEDITNFKAQEERLKESEELLYQSQKMEVVGRLAGGIAHDFNNVLTVLKGYTELICDFYEENDFDMKYPKEMRKAVDHATQLTRQLLFLSRNRSHDPQVIDLNETINNFSNILKRAIGDEIEFILNLTDSKLSILLDTGPLEQIMMNLVINARHAIEKEEEGKIEIKSELLPSENIPSKLFVGKNPAENYAKLSVIDNGGGMSKEILNHIYEPFFTTKGAGVGTGLGLTIVYSIVQQNMAMIDILSELGKGTTVDIYFPLINQTQIKTSKLQLDQLYPNSTRGKRILVIDDDVSILRLITYHLKEVGHEPIGFADSRKALEFIEKKLETVDLIITDIIMPHINGYQLIKIAKAKNADLNCIMISGYNRVDKEDIRHIQDVTLLEKPFQMQKLIELVNEVLHE